MKTLKDEVVTPQGKVKWILEGKEYFRLEDVAQAIKELKKQIWRFENGKDWEEFNDTHEIIDKIFGNFEQKGSDEK